MLAPADRRLRRALGLAGGLVAFGFLAGALLAVPLVTGLWPAAPLALLQDPYLRGIVAFTLEQAALSALLSLALGIPLGLALHRTRLPGRAFVLRLFLVPQALPPLVGALGLLAVFGRGGWLGDAFALAGLPRPSIYGLAGILLAHVFFNAALVARLVYGALGAVPHESWRIAGQLGLSPLAVLRHVEGPAVLRALPQAASLVFALCVTSFTLVLVLGGGPAATTVEVAVYQALRYDFDPGRALALALLQIGLVALALAPLLMIGGSTADLGLGHAGAARRFDRPSRGRTVLDGFVIALGLALLLCPLAALVANGLAADLGRLVGDPAVARAALTSLLVAVPAALLGLGLSLALALAAAGGGTFARLAAGGASALVLVVPPIVVGAGWFLLLRGTGDVARLAPVVVVVAQAVLILPYGVRLFLPAIVEADRRHGRLALGLGLTGWARLRHLEGPALRRPASLALGLALAVSLGDLSTVALFGSTDFTTLPLLLLQRMGSYRSADAAGLALLLGLGVLAVLLAAEVSGRQRGETRA
ncbi:ABC transporter permease subunit [Aureimonas jatrophae]|uniref:ABC transporter permease subunit n=1 Tax=Aureimonas jatrophae TaxID=1166073 RepID=UPI000B1DEAA2|nr:ABC transporter permease subunit [Aureimonas jatrophae]MBB3950626.1 thiamine transport system permease protein [Aureimonas jatrophae]